MIIIGLDPGSYHFGYGVIKVERRGSHLLNMGSVNLHAKIALPERLLTIYQALKKVFSECNPSYVGLESVFFHKNVKSMSILAQSRAIGILVSAEFQCELLEVSPRKIKQSVTGNGNASKEQVHIMVKQLLSMTQDNIDFNASDAVATALCVENLLKFKSVQETVKGESSVSNYKGISNHKRASSKWTLQAVKNMKLNVR